MKILVLGATGATGGLFTEQAAAAGHDIVAYARNPTNVPALPHVAVVGGDVLDPDALAAAMAGTDALVSMLGLGNSPAPKGFSADSARSIVTAAQSAKVPRVLVMSAFGVGRSLPKASLLARTMYRTGGRAIYADKAAGEQLITASSLDWTLAYPVLLTNGPRTDAFRAVDLDTLQRLPGMPKISRADVAAFLLAAIPDSQWVRRTAVLTS